MAQTFTVTNQTPTTIIAPQVEGHDYRVEPGDSIDVHARTALLLREYGLTIDPSDYADAVRVESDPVEDVETRFTGTTEGVDTRQHRIDDPRANVAGTPLEETGDTGSPLNTEAKVNGGELESPDVPKVPAAKNAKAAVLKGAAAVNDPKTQPAVSEHEQTDIAAPSVEQDAEPGALSAAAAQAINKPASTGTLRAVGRGAANAPRTGAIPAVPAAGAGGGSTDAGWVDELDRKALDVELERRGLQTVGMASADKRNALRAYVEAYGSDAHQ